MDLYEAIRTRHSVRRYTNRKIEGDVLEELRREIDECNRESGLHIQLCLNEPKAFSGMMARYGKFSNVKNYIALVGRQEDGVEEKCGYYGERIVLKAARLGLNTCWVGMSYSKGKSDVRIGKGEKLHIVIAVGYGQNGGEPHKVKTIQELSRIKEGEVMPDWFLKGMEAVRLAPTAVNQQRFLFTLSGNTVKAAALPGFYTKVDLGIAKYHFEAGAGGGDWSWG